MRKFSNILIGSLYGLCGMVLESLIPIISNTRPPEVDAFFFSWGVVVFELFTVLPFMFWEKAKQDSHQIAQIDPQMPVRRFSRRYLVGLSLLIGVIFSVALILQYIGFNLAGAIVGSIVLKSSIFYSLLLGWISLKEKISPRQFIFTCVLMFGIVLTLTHGFTTGFDVNIGGLLLLIVPFLWMVGHSFTKILLKNRVALSLQILVNRVFISSLLIGIVDLSFYPVSNFTWLTNPRVLLWLILAGIDYGLAHICWYRLLIYIPLSKSTTIYALTPMVSGLFAVAFLGEEFTLVLILGMAIVISAIFVIMKEPEHPPKSSS